MPAKTVCATFFVLALQILPAFAQDKPPAPAPLGAIEVQLPEGDLRMFFVEAPGGMELLLQTGDSHVQARRLFLGDGKVAVAYEATSSGVWSQGRQLPNQAAFDFKHRSMVQVAREHLQPWGRHAGEVYVRLQGIDFRAAER